MAVLSPHVVETNAFINRLSIDSLLLHLTEGCRIGWRGPCYISEGYLHHRMDMQSIFVSLSVLDFHVYWPLLRGSRKQQ